MHIKRKRNGFSLLEVMISAALIVLIATTAMASLRSGLRTLGGVEQASMAVDAIRDMREYTYNFTTAELDAMNGQQLTPLLGNGDPMPGASDMLLDIVVTAVSDLDPETQVLANESVTRIVTITASMHGRITLEASWLAADY
jgi:prepilin-type N-terminal cleavage/methylation domain-containing protein